jgi:hypothetical protein
VTVTDEVIIFLAILQMALPAWLNCTVSPPVQATDRAEKLKVTDPGVVPPPGDTG